MLKIALVTMRAIHLILTVILVIGTALSAVMFFNVIGDYMHFVQPSQAAMIGRLVTWCATVLVVLVYLLTRWIVAQLQKKQYRDEAIQYIGQSAR